MSLLLATTNASAPTTVPSAMSRVLTFLWDISVSQACYLINFEDIHKSLDEKMEKLKALKEDLDRRIRSSEAKQQTRLAVVDFWMRRVESIQPVVEKILRECLEQEEQRCIADCCPKNWWACYKLGKEASKMILVVENLINDSDFPTVADKSVPNPLELVRVDQSVGMDVMLEEVWTLLGQEGVKMIGIYGMGGIGKTLLLKKINNKFCQKDQNFDAVMFVVVSKDFSKANIQKQIGERLGLTWSESDDENTKKNHIFNLLSKKKFVVLLDDIWEMIDLEAIGLIPVHNNFKIVFTTRSEKVCAEMEVSKKIEVPTLRWEEAWDLFQQKVGKEVLEAHSDIPMLAKKVAKECGGLPLALITIGRAMSNKKTPPEWEHALSTLQKRASEFSGMEKVLSILKFSYESLESDTCRDCFLYFSLYPEDWSVFKGDIIMHWIAEGLLEDTSYNKGHAIIGSLKEACLLEAGLYSEENEVKMHDVIRDLALWIAQGCGQKNDNILVEAGVGLTQAPNTKRWRNAKRVSIMGSDIQELTEVPESPHLLTLLLQRNYYLLRIVDDFFQYMPNLRVLNLSTTNITKVPESIGCLLQLRALNLSETKIRTLPAKMEDLKQLKWLYLSSIRSFIIPHETISRLSSLQSLLINRSGFIRKGNSYDLIQKALECLEHLSNLGITIEEVSTLHSMLTSPKLRSSITSLEICLCKDLMKLEMAGSSLLRNITNLSSLCIENCMHFEEMTITCAEQEDDIGLLSTLRSLTLVGLPNLVRISWIERGTDFHFKRLTYVRILGCHALKDMSWLVFLPVLKDLDIMVSYEIEEIIPGEFAVTTTGNRNAFSSLQYVSLLNLPKLKSISAVALSFPALKYMHVRECPLLKTLPFTVNSANKPSLQIQGMKGWWNGLQWENETIKTHFQSFFVEVKTESEASTSTG